MSFEGNSLRKNYVPFACQTGAAKRRPISGVGRDHRRVLRENESNTLSKLQKQFRRFPSRRQNSANTALM